MVILQGQRSIIWVKIAHFGHNFCNIQHSNLVFGMHVYLIELHILSGERSRLSFKVKVKGHFFLNSKLHPQPSVGIRSAVLLLQFGILLNILEHIFISFHFIN